MIEMMIARIADIPANQEATWRAVLSVLRFDHRDGMKVHWRAERPRDGGPFTFVEVEMPGEDVAALRAEIEEIVVRVNQIADRDPLKVMARAEPGLIEG